MVTSVCSNNTLARVLTRCACVDVTDCDGECTSSFCFSCSLHNIKLSARPAVAPRNESANLP